VIGVPDLPDSSGESICSQASAFLCRGLNKNRYVGRNLHQTHPGDAGGGIRVKSSPLPDVLAGKRVVVIR